MQKKFGRLTKEIAYPIIARYLNSGLGPREFYTKEGFSESRFYDWRSRYLKDHNTGSLPSSGVASSIDDPAVFHPIQVTPTSSPDPVIKSQRMQIELEYPNGVILRMDSALDDTRLACLIKLY